MTAVRPHRAVSIARHRLGTDLPAIGWLWALFALLVVAVAAAVAVVGEISGSVWEPASQVPRWFAAGTGFWLLRSGLALYVVHGRPRHEFLRQVPAVIVGHAAVLGALTTVGLVVETVAFDLLGWPQTMSREHLFTAPTQWGLVLLESSLLLAVWSAAGALVGAAVARLDGLGLLLVPAALAAVTVAETVVGPGLAGPAPFAAGRVGTFLFGGLVTPGLGPSEAAATCVAVAAVALAVASLFARHVPVRSRAG